MFETREEDKTKVVAMKKKYQPKSVFEVEFSMFFFSYLTWITKWKERKKKTNKQNHPILSHRTRKEFLNIKKGEN